MICSMKNFHVVVGDLHQEIEETVSAETALNHGNRSHPAIDVIGFRCF